MKHFRENVVNQISGETLYASIFKMNNGYAHGSWSIKDSTEREKRCKKSWNFESF